MKKYDRQLKKWVTVEEYERTHQQKDKKFCRGKRPHDFVLVLPTGVTYNEKYRFDPESYYKIMDERVAFIEGQKRQLEQMGILQRWGSSWNSKETRLYMCSVCKKQKYENN